MTKDTGTLHYDYQEDRYIIAFDDSTKIPLSLHCGDCLDALINGRWKETRMESTSERWYLVGVKAKPEGLRVRY